MSIKRNYIRFLLIHFALYSIILAPVFLVSTATIAFAYFGLILIFVLSATSETSIIKRKEGVNKRFATAVSYFVYLLAIALYGSVSATVVGNNLSFATQVFKIILMLIVGYSLGRILFSDNYDIEKFQRFVFAIFSFCMLFNAILCLAQVYDEEIRSWFEAFLYQPEDSNIDYENSLFRVRGLAAGGGAALSLANSLGAWYFLASIAEKRINLFVGIIFAAILMSANIFVGRTGLIACIIFFILFFGVLFFRGSRSLKIKYIFLFSLFLVLVVYLFLLLREQLDPRITGWAFQWMFWNDSDSGTSSVNDLVNMLNFHDDLIIVIFGSGYFIGDSVLGYFTDSGYLKVVASIGLPLAISFYSILFFLLYKCAKVSGNMIFIIPVVFILGISEIKEPFLIQNYAARLVYILIGGSIYHYIHGGFFRVGHFPTASNGVLNENTSRNC